MDLELKPLLDCCLDRLKSGEAISSIDELAYSLNKIRDIAQKKDKIALFKQFCQSHPLHQLLLEDPYTHRAFYKPRGYAGDAIMMDFIYSSKPLEGTSEIGKQIFQATTRLPNGLSVIWRRDFLAQKIDEIATSNHQAKIASIACGHLREAQKSQAIKQNIFGEFVGFDQDSESLEIVNSEQKYLGVQTACDSITRIISGKVSFQNFNLIYSAGLYDYLSNRMARRLTKCLFSMLASKGKLVLANFTPYSHGRGYMEAFMNWDLIYRDEKQCESIISDIDSCTIETFKIFHDPYKNVIYIELQKI